ncbi:transporter substrate-binding domain-containing protein [Pseudoduganella ginsengisoli]|uniref:Transporter substrate-binding domain-containing protein n=1 Tax=Pseudoduganella ginsengisoli TaxID=1462440 RepID=A0A6L6Q8Y8_9BURK|nr:hypothetical protein [Pseudoduganella ginsengisoli]MTW05682.1 hypothetical protein [Pseudoduganella ginsengisoli]
MTSGAAHLPKLPRRTVLRLGAGVAALAACPAIIAQAPVAVRCPYIGNDIDQVSFDMLRLALGHVPGNFTFHTRPPRMERGRALHELARGEFLDVAWAVTSREREAALLPIRIPLDRGLSGWRICLVRRADVERFAAVDQLAGLARFQAGLGYDWVETSVLRANGLPVVTGNNSDSLPAMLAGQRFDYYPRPLRQAWVDLQKYPNLALEVEPHFALHFPSALYLFVNKANTALADLLLTGLRKAIDDGTFEKLFTEQYSAYLQRAALGQRRVFHLENPSLTPDTPLAARELWYFPPL